MAWSTPLTAVANAALTAAQWNASVRDNLLQTAVAKASAAGRIIVTNGVNIITERVIADDVVEAADTTTSTSYVNLANPGPQVVVTTGPLSLVWINAQISNSGTSTSAASIDISLATVSGPVSGRAILCDGGSGAANRYGVCNLLGVNSGSNRYTMQYLVTGGTGTFQKRRMQVMAL